MTVTSRGRGLALATLLLYFVAVALGYPEVAVLATGALVALGCGFLAVARRPRLEVTRTIAPARITRGMRAYGELVVTNVGLAPSTPVIAREPCGQQRPVPVAIRRLARHQKITKRYPLPTQRRGVIPIGPLRLTRRDAFGLFERVQRQGEVTELWVRPVVHPLATLPVGSTRSLDGPDQDHAPHGSITFDRLREWQMGDDPRHIHWRSTARTGTLMVREHVDTSLPRLTVVLDDRADSATPDQFEEAVEVAASIVVAAVTAGFPAVLLTVCGEGAQGRGQGRDPQAFLDALTRVQQAEDGSATATAVRARRTGRSSLVVVTGASGVDQIQPLLAGRRHFENATVVVISEDELSYPSAPDVRWLRAATGRAVAEMWGPMTRAS